MLAVERWITNRGLSGGASFMYTCHLSPSTTFFRSCFLCDASLPPCQPPSPINDCQDGIVFIFVILSIPVVRSSAPSVCPSFTRASPPYCLVGELCCSQGHEGHPDRSLMAYNYQVNCTDAPPAALPWVAPQLRPLLHWRPYTCATDYSRNLLYTLRMMPSLIDLDLIMAKRRVVVELRAGKDAARVQAPSSAGVCHMTLIVGAFGN